jgi:hypothetical protein
VRGKSITGSEARECADRHEGRQAREVHAHDVGSATAMTQAARDS